MTSQPNNPQPPDDRSHTAPESSIEPAPESAPTGTPKSVASELFSHGLLTYLNTDTPARQGERIGKLMATVEHDALRATGVPPASSSSSHSFRFPIRTARGWLALAACITIATVAVFIGIPGEQSAQAVVQQSIDAMRSTAGGDRRYEIRLQRPSDDALPSLPGAIIDTRSPNLLLLRSNSPDGHEIIAGRDGTGDWCIRVDGGIEREHPEQAWPKWSKVGQESLLVDSVDRLLEELTKSYDLQKEGTAALDGKPGVSFRHVVGTKKRVRSPGGDHVEVWIDPDSKAVERIEMRWDTPRGAAPREDKSPDAMNAHPGGPRDGAPDAARPGAPDRDINHDPNRDPMDQRPPRRDGFRPGGPRPDGPGPNSPGPGGRGPDALGPDGDGPDRPDGPDDRAPEGRRPRKGHELDGPRPRPEPRPDGPLPGGPGGRPDGARRDAGPDGPRNGPGPGGGPGPNGSPGMPCERAGFGPPPRGPGPGARPNPPRKLVMQRVDAPTFDAAWFTPDAHKSKE